MKRVPVQALVTVLAFCTLWIAFGSQIVPGARKHDFLNLYTGASLALEGNFAGLHDPVVQLNRERTFVPALDALVPFVRPHFYAALLAPLALIPFGPAFWVWVTLQTLLLIGCWIWALQRWGPDALIFGSMFLPTALGIAHGQDCVVLLVIAIVAFVLLERDRPIGSGAVLALGLIKFHLWLLWPLVLVVQKRWKMLGGYGACALAEFLASWLLGGTGGLIGYVRLLQKKDIEHLNPSPELTISVHGLALNLTDRGWFIRAALVVLVIALVIVSARNAPQWRWFAAASAGSLLVSPHVYGYDAGLLLLGVWLGIFCSGDGLVRLAAATLATPLPFMMTLAGKPWAALTPLLLLVFMGTLALAAFRNRVAGLAAGAEAGHAAQVRIT